MRIANLAAEMSLRVRNAAFTMKLVSGPTEFLALNYDPARTGKELLVGNSAAAFSAASGEEVALELFLDGSVVEIFVNEVCCLTTRVYQIPAEHLSIEISAADLANVRSLQVWEMTPISRDRLTT